MKTKTSQIADQLNTCLTERQQAANELQNEINQILASALLWIRFAKMENKLTADESVHNAEINLKEAIERVRALHYSLAEDIK
jgi:signal transduction histidine kinase